MISGGEFQNLDVELEISRQELRRTIEKLILTNRELGFRNEELNRSRKYSEAIVTTIREPLIVLNKDLRVQTANPSFYKTFQSTKEVTEGKLFYELQNSQWDIPELRSLLERTLQKEIFYESYEVKQKFTSIGERVMILNAREIFSDDDREHLILLAIEDITERRILEEKLKKSADYVKAVLESSPQISFAASAEGTITYFNLFFLEYAGLNLEEAIQWGWNSVVHPEMQKELTVAWNHSLQTGEDFERELLFKRHDGVYRWHMSRAIAIRNEAGIITSWIGTANDTHDQKMFSEELEKKVLERTQLLKESNNELAHSNKNLEQFAFIASHDLQEPLRKIKTFSNMLDANFKSALPAEGQKLVDRIVSSSERISTLINDVLSFSRIENTQHAFIATDLNGILHNVLVDFNLLISEKKAIIRQEQLPTLEVIPFQINQLFYNLISNALKFSRAAIQPILTIKSRRLTRDEVLSHSSLYAQLNYYEISVEDNGIGFEEEYGDRIFAIFQRLHSERDYPGTGIGLALCKKIVIGHHGEIFAKATLNKGASFHILLPATQEYVPPAN